MTNRIQKITDSAQTAAGATLGLIFIACAAMMVFMFLEITKWTSDAIWPLTTMFVLYFGGGMLVRHGGWSINILAGLGLLLYIGGWPVAYGYNAHLGQTLSCGGVLVVGIAVYMAIFTDTRDTVLSHFKRHRLEWVCAAGFCQVIPWILYALITDPGYYAVRTDSRFTMLMFFVSTVVAMFSIIGGIALYSCRTRLDNFH